MEKLSIIVPIFNTEKYLKRTIDSNSILAQTYSNIELILIDDGSTDGSGAICDDYASGDSRICVYHQQNKGLRISRYLGVTYAKADYVAS